MQMDSKDEIRFNHTICRTTGLFKLDQPSSGKRHCHLRFNLFFGYLRKKWSWIYHGPFFIAAFVEKDFLCPEGFAAGVQRLQQTIVILNAELLSEDWSGSGICVQYLIEGSIFRIPP